MFVLLNSLLEIQFFYLQTLTNSVNACSRQNHTGYEVWMVDGNVDLHVQHMQLCSNSVHT